MKPLHFSCAFFARRIELGPSVTLNAVALFRLVSFVACASVAWALPQTASACGGTFCDSPNPASAVEQTGETIMFVFDGDFVEAHVQIEYEGGDASQFAWLVPLPQVPEVEVGSWRLIENSLNATVPVYGFDSVSTCDDSDSGDPTVGFISNPDGGSGSGTPPPRVVVADTVGAFEYVVLQGGTPESVNDWLIDEGYSANPAAPGILQEYLDESMLFLAFKLRHFAGTADIHPVVIRYPGDEPCVPLRLTRIAAEDDMPIRVLFLGEDRVLPTTYKHVKLNRVKLDWFNTGANYDELVARAIDEAGGRAFVTEYAGTSSMVGTENLRTDHLDASVFESMEVTEVVDQLTAYELMSCGRTCAYEHELVSSLLSEFVPAPAGLDPLLFYACLDCYPQLIDQDAWDGPAFATAFQERVIDPMEHARDVLGVWPYLTRLYTRISPEEMLADPMFEEVQGLPEVPNRLGAERESDCCSTVWNLPGGRSIRAESFSEFPTFPDMPWAERIEEFNPVGPPLTEYSASNEIDQMIAAHNAPFGCDEDTDTGMPPPGGTGGDTGGLPPGTGGSGVPSSGTGDTANGDGGGGIENPNGCGCRASGNGAWLGLLVLLLGWRRRCDG